jgi:hypothetical protein
LTADKDKFTPDAAECLKQCVAGAMNIAEQMCGGTDDEHVALLTKTISKLKHLGLGASWDDVLEVVRRKFNIFFFNTPTAVRLNYYDQVLHNLIDRYGMEEVQQLLIEEFRWYLELTVGEEDTVHYPISWQRASSVDFRRAIFVDCPFAKWTEEQKSKMVAALERDPSGESCSRSTRFQKWVRDATKKWDSERSKGQ